MDSSPHSVPAMRDLTLFYQGWWDDKQYLAIVLTLLHGNKNKIGACRSAYINDES